MSTFQDNRLDKADAAVLLVDHQSGLTNLVQDFSPDDFKNSVLALAEAAKYFKPPAILTTSFEDGPNGPLVPEIEGVIPRRSLHRAARQHQRLGQRGLVKAVKASGKETTYCRRHRH